jgi:hypothetical protein
VVDLVRRLRGYLAQNLVVLTLHMHCHAWKWTAALVSPIDRRGIGPNR